MSETLSAEWLTAPATREVLAALAPARPLFVGGCVRDALLGREAEDVDLCVVSPPEETARLLVAAGLKAAPTGVAHGTVTAVAHGRGFEVTTLRRDLATDGRRAVVAFTDDPAEDAGRRDFTLNALYADAAGRVTDPLREGLADLRAGRVRFIGRAEDRIREDYLRILRFFRFSARFARRLDPGGLAACARLAEGLDGLARERVGWEMRRLLALPDPAPALAAMAEAGVLARVAPGADAAALPPLLAAERAAGAAPEWPRRALAIGAERADWRFSRAEGARLKGAAEALTAGAGPDEAAQRWSAAAARDAALVRAGREGGPPPAALEAELARGEAACFPLAARDLMAKGVARGPALGRGLARAREAWIASGFALEREALLARALDAAGEEA